MLGFNLLLHSVIIIELTQNIEGQLVNKLELKNFKNDITQLKIEGLDCSNPTEVTHSSLKQMCQQHKVIGNIEQNAEVAIIQSVDYRIREAYTCTMYVSELDVHCGIWSYMKLEQPMSVRVPAKVSITDCLTVLNTNQLIGKDGSRHFIKENNKVFYKYVEHGGITVTTDNVHCNSNEAMIVNGQKVDGVIALKSIEFHFSKITLHETTYNIKDHTNDFYLPQGCIGRQGCQLGDATYIFPKVLKTGNDCFYSLVRVLPMKVLKIHNYNHFLSTEHKILLRMGQVITKGKEGCKPLPNTFKTQIDDIFVLSNLTNSASELYKAANELGQITDFQYNPAIQERVITSFNSYYLSTKLNHKLAEMEERICTNMATNLNLQQLSPFHENRIMTKRGDLLTEYKCRTINLWVKLTPPGSDIQTCYKGHVLAWKDQKPYHVHLGTRIINKPSNLHKMECQRQREFMVIQGRTVDIHPYPKIIDLRLDHWNSSIFHCPDLHIENGQGDLYTAEEIQSGEHYRRYLDGKEQVTSLIYKNWCDTQEKGTCDAHNMIGEHPELNTWDRILSLSPTYSWYLKIKNGISEFGNFTSIIVAIYVISKIIYKCATQMKKKWKGQKEAVATQQGGTAQVTLNLSPLTPLGGSWGESVRDARSTAYNDTQLEIE